MNWFSPFLYAPFYIVAIYAFIYEKEWIRVPSESLQAHYLTCDSSKVEYKILICLA